MKELFTTLGVLLVILLGLIYWIDTLDENAQPTTEVFNVICLDGVEYWYRQVGYKGMMAVRMNTDGTVSLCEE